MMVSFYCRDLISMMVLQHLKVCKNVSQVQLTNCSVHKFNLLIIRFARSNIMPFTFKLQLLCTGTIHVDQYNNIVRIQSCKLIHPTLGVELEEQLRHIQATIHDVLQPQTANKVVYTVQVRVFVHSSSTENKQKLYSMKKYIP